METVAPMPVPHSSWMKWLSLILLIITALAAIGIFLAFLLFVNLFNDSGAPESAALLSALLISSPVFVVVLPFWITSLVFFIKQKYKKSLITFGVFVIVLVILQVVGMILMSVLHN